MPLKDYYETQPAYFQPTNRLLEDAAVDGVFAITDLSLTTNLSIAGGVLDMQDVAISDLSSNSAGFFPQFQVPGHTQILVKSGPYVVALTSLYGPVLAAGLDPDTVAAAIAAAAAAQSSAIDAAASAAAAAAGGTGGSGIVGAPTTWPGTFPSSPHTHPTTEISDSTVVGKALMKAVDQQAGRAAIGAGTGNGTSNLIIGTSATTAAAGNHGHNASAVGFTPTADNPATNVQQAIEIATSTGGGGTGGGNVKVVYWASGQYPAFPTTRDTSIGMYILEGPLQPTTANVSGGFPAYIGDGAGKTAMDYRLRNLT